MAQGKPKRVSKASRNRIEREFQLQLGRTIISYSRIELFLCLYFQRITQMHPIVARRVFYSQNGTYATLQMFRAALGFVNTVPDVKPFLIAALNKLQKYSEVRNRMAHGDAVFVEVANSRYYGQMIIVQGQEAFTNDPSTEDVLTHENLVNANDNFGRLAYSLAVILTWDGKDHEKSPDRFLPLIRLLPNLAHSKRLDQTTLRPFVIDESELPHSR